MKEKLVRVARQYVPKSGIRGLEEVYRRGRATAVTARYGFPAKGQRIIAITGTNGKTTTASYLNEILKASGLKTAMFTTAVIEMAGERKINDLNATVAATAQMQQFLAKAKKAKVDFVLIETTSHALHQHKLSGMKVEVAIMTNLTQDHLDYHGTMENYAAAKGRLFSGKPAYIVLNRDDQWFDFFNQYPASKQKITYGTEPEADCRITRASLKKNGSDVHLQIDHQTGLDFHTSLPGKFNVYNAAAAVSAAYMLHVSLENIQKGVAALKSVPGRQEYVEIEKPYDVVVDYAHTPDALEKLLDSMKQLSKGRVILVFGACGDRDKAKRPIMGEIAARLADRIVLTDEEPYNEDPQAIRAQLMEGISGKRGQAMTEEIADRREAIAKAMKIARKGDVVVVTGMGHEQYRIVQGKRIPWNDAEVVRELAA